jgi:hypothetical protein
MMMSCSPLLTAPIPVLCVPAAVAVLNRIPHLQVSQLQRLFFKHWPQLYDLAMANCAAACAPDGLRRALRQLQGEELRQLVCTQLRLVGEDDPWAQVSICCYANVWVARRKHLSCGSWCASSCGGWVVVAYGGVSMTLANSMLLNHTYCFDSTVCR